MTAELSCVTRPATAKCNLALVGVCARVGVSLDLVFITSFFFRTVVVVTPATKN